MYSTYIQSYIHAGSRVHACVVYGGILYRYVVTTIESQYLMKNQSYLDEILLRIFVRS